MAEDPRHEQTNKLKKGYRFDNWAVHLISHRIQTKAQRKRLQIVLFKNESTMRCEV